MIRVPIFAERPNPRRSDASAKTIKARRNAWVLGVLVILFYFGMIAWNLLRGFVSGAVN
jgi:hypothetical protein